MFQLLLQFSLGIDHNDFYVVKEYHIFLCILKLNEFVILDNNYCSRWKTELSGILVQILCKTAHLLMFIQTACDAALYTVTEKSLYLCSRYGATFTSLHSSRLCISIGLASNSVTFVSNWTIGENFFKIVFSTYFF